MPALVPNVPFGEEFLLLDELNHRIINEFASAISMISRAAAHFADEEVKDALGGVALLLHGYAQVHRALQPPHEETLINAEGYLSKVCQAINRARLDHMNIDLFLTAPPLLMSASQCWRLGMIVYELVTNATRHAFAGRRGEIRVELSRNGGFVTCSVADNGSAPSFVQPGRGLRIVEELSRSLDGRFERKFGPRGSISTLIFPCHEPPPQADGASAFGPDHAGEFQWRSASKTTR